MLEGYDQQKEKEKALDYYKESFYHTVTDMIPVFFPNGRGITEAVNRSGRVIKIEASVEKDEDGLEAPEPIRELLNLVYGGKPVNIETASFQDTSFTIHVDPERDQDFVGLRTSTFVALPDGESLIGTTIIFNADQVTINYTSHEVQPPETYLTRNMRPTVQIHSSDISPGIIYSAAHFIKDIAPRESTALTISHQTTSY